MLTRNRGQKKSIVSALGLARNKNSKTLSQVSNSKDASKLSKQNKDDDIKNLKSTRNKKSFVVAEPEINQFKKSRKRGRKPIKVEKDPEEDEVLDPSSETSKSMDSLLQIQLNTSIESANQSVASDMSCGTLPANHNIESGSDVVENIFLKSNGKTDAEETVKCEPLIKSENTPKKEADVRKNICAIDSKKFDQLFTPNDGILRDILEFIKTSGRVPSPAKVLLHRRDDYKSNSDQFYIKCVPKVESVLNDIWNNANPNEELDTKDSYLTAVDLMRPGIFDTLRKRRENYSKSLSRGVLGRLRPNPRPRKYSDMVAQHGLENLSGRLVTRGSSYSRSQNIKPCPMPQVSAARITAAKKLNRAKGRRAKPLRYCEKMFHKSKRVKVNGDGEDSFVPSSNTSECNLAVRRSRRRHDISQHIDWKFCYNQPRQAGNYNRRFRMKTRSRAEQDIYLSGEEFDDGTADAGALENVSDFEDQVPSRCAVKASEMKKTHRHEFTTQRKRPTHQLDTMYSDIEERLSWRQRNLNRLWEKPKPVVSKVSDNRTYSNASISSDSSLSPSEETDYYGRLVHKKRMCSSKDSSYSLENPLHYSTHRRNRSNDGFMSKHLGMKEARESYYRHKVQRSRRERSRKLTLIDRLVLGLDCKVLQGKDEIHIKQLHADDLNILTQRTSKTGFVIQSLSLKAHQNKDPEYNLVLTFSRKRYISTKYLKYQQNREISEDSHENKEDRISRSGLPSDYFMPYDSINRASKTFSETSRGFVESVKNLPVRRRALSLDEKRLNVCMPPVRSCLSETNLTECHVYKSKKEPKSEQCIERKHFKKESSFHSMRMNSDELRDESGDSDYELVEFPTSFHDSSTYPDKRRRLLDHKRNHQKNSRISPLNAREESRPLSAESNQSHTNNLQKEAKRPVAVVDTPAVTLPPTTSLSFRRHSPRKIIRKVYTGTSNVPKILNRKRPVPCTSSTSSISNVSQPISVPKELPTPAAQYRPQNQPPGFPPTTSSVMSNVSTNSLIVSTPSTQETNTTSVLLSAIQQTITKITPNNTSSVKVKQVIENENCMTAKPSISSDVNVTVTSKPPVMITRAHDIPDEIMLMSQGDQSDSVSESSINSQPLVKNLPSAARNQKIEITVSRTPESSPLAVETVVSDSGKDHSNTTYQKENESKPATSMSASQLLKMKRSTDDQSQATMSKKPRSVSRPQIQRPINCLPSNQPFDLPSCNNSLSNEVLESVNVEKPPVVIPSNNSIPIAQEAIASSKLDDFDFELSSGSNKIQTNRYPVGYNQTKVIISTPNAINNTTLTTSSAFSQKSGNQTTLRALGSFPARPPLLTAKNIPDKYLRYVNPKPSLSCNTTPNSQQRIVLQSHHYPKEQNLVPPQPNENDQSSATSDPTLLHLNKPRNLVHKCHTFRKILPKASDGKSKPLCFGQDNVIPNVSSSFSSLLRIHGSNDTNPGQLLKSLLEKRSVPLPNQQPSSPVATIQQHSVALPKSPMTCAQVPQQVQSQPPNEIVSWDQPAHQSRGTWQLTKRAHVLSATRTSSVPKFPQPSPNKLSVGANGIAINESREQIVSPTQQSIKVVRLLSDTKSSDLSSVRTNPDYLDMDS